MDCQESLEQPVLLKEEGSGVKPYPWTGVILLLILLLGASLRLYRLGQISPPGLNQDEAANAWSAYCILKTGKDYAGASWPFFYVKNVGGNSSALYVYMIIPFQAVAGLNIYTTRLPAALAAIFNIWVIYLVGKRLFDAKTGLVAAVLLAVDPWELQLSRWGHDASATVFLSLAPLALMLWANMPITDDKSLSPRPLPAAVAGVLSGIVCYGYYAVRLFVPVFIFLVVIFTLLSWWQSLKTRKGMLAIAAFIIGFTAIYGPLIWQHIFHSEGVARHLWFLRDRTTSIPILVAVKNYILHYIRHFGPSFLFIAGDSHTALSPPGMGQFYWYMLPLMLAGLISIIRRFKSSLCARVILAFVLAYPAGDCLMCLEVPSNLRSSPGLCGLLLLAAVGAVDAFRWVWLKSRKAALTATALFVLVAIGFNTLYLHCFFGEFNQRPDVYHFFHTDFVEACEWLRPRFDEYDAIFCTTDRLNMPYVISTVVLGYDPNRWFNEPREFMTRDEFDYCTRYGKMYFVYNPSFLEPLSRLPRNARILFIVRPGELDLKNPIHQIYRPYDGEPALWMCQP
jgi:4-amino-4-deoxy-L-arabinose transferase-like glycosyltransferase